MLVEKKFDDFNDGIELELSRKRQSSEKKLEEVKKLQYVFKSNLNEISKGGFKSYEQNMTKNVKLLYKSQEAVINYLIIILQLYLRLNTKQNMEKVSKY